jgi:hypothetical protein
MSKETNKLSEIMFALDPSVSFDVDTKLRGVIQCVHVKTLLGS